jgi:formate dehydrogenase subunit beta
LEQANLENLLFISFTCSGVFTLSHKRDDLEKKLTEFKEKSKSGENLPGIRETCTVCEDFIPDNADIIIGLAGIDHVNTTAIFAKTSRAETAIQGMDLQPSTHTLGSDMLETVRRMRTENKQKVFSGLKTEELGWEGLITLFGRCINCRACSSVCPICYCKLCYIRSPEKDRSPLSWVRELNQKGSLRIPDDTVMYHLVRLLHVSLMCVGCGMCSDVCPTRIPIASIFTKAGDHVQDAMDYAPGRDLEQEIPLAVVHPEDFTDTNPAED